LQHLLFWAIVFTKRGSGKRMQGVISVGDVCKKSKLDLVIQLKETVSDFENNRILK